VRARDPAPTAVPRADDASCERRESRALARSQAGAPLSWTSERADTFFVCERVRKAAATKRQPRERSEQCTQKRAEASFLCERRRRRRIHSAMREQLKNAPHLLLGVAGEKLSEHLPERCSGIQLRKDSQSTQPHAMDEQIAGWQVQLHCHPA
jgi:hypothetical protein